MDCVRGREGKNPVTYVSRILPLGKEVGKLYTYMGDVESSQKDFLDFRQRNVTLVLLLVPGRGG